MFNSVADKLRFSLLCKIVRLSTLSVVVGCCLLLFHLSEKYHLSILAVLGGVFFVIGLFILFFTLPEVFARMEEKGTLLFRSAIAHTLYGYAMRLSFLPLIGPTLERFFFRPKETNPFITEDDKRR